MITDDQIIVLRTIKHAEGSLVIQSYSRNSGRISIYGAGIGKRGSRGGAQLFHPMSVLDVTIFHKGSASMPSIKEVHPCVPLTSIRSSITKGCITLFMSELFQKCIMEQEPNIDLFNFMKTMIQLLESAEEGLANFPAMFAIHFCSIIGFRIKNNYRPGGCKLFNMNSGSFVEGEFHLQKEMILPPEESQFLATLANADFTSLSGIQSCGRVRKSCILGLVRFISIQLGYDIELKSLEVASAVLEPMFV